MSVRSRWFLVLLRSSVYLLIFCLIVLYIVENEVLKAPSNMHQEFLILICILQRNRRNRRGVCVCITARERNFKELAHVIAEV